MNHLLWVSDTSNMAEVDERAPTSVGEGCSSSLHPHHPHKHNQKSTGFLLIYRIKTTFSTFVFKRWLDFRKPGARSYQARTSSQELS